MAAWFFPEMRKPHSLPLRGGVLVSALGIALSVWASDGHATVIYTNTADALPFSGGSPTGGAPLNPTDTAFNTPQVAVSQNGDTIDLQFATSFSPTGSVSVNGGTTYAADIFLALGNASSTPINQAGYNYAIVLGDQMANGGLSTPGLYQVSSEKTSNTIWAPRAGTLYGGEYELNSNPNDINYAPVAVTAGTQVSGWTVSESWSAGTSGVTSAPNLLDVTLTASDATTLALLLGNDDLFWATSDSAAGPIFEDIALGGNNSVAGTYDAPEPPAFSIFAVALAGFIFLRRHRRTTYLAAA